MSGGFFTDAGALAAALERGGTAAMAALHTRIRRYGRPRVVDCRGKERVGAVRRCSVGCYAWRLCHTSAAPPSIASVVPVT